MIQLLEKVKYVWNNLGMWIYFFNRKFDEI